MYIYKITNKKNNKVYIGQTVKNIKESESYFGSGKIIKKAIQKYGIDNFTKEVLCECKTNDELDKKEIYYIKHYDCLSPNGYNISMGGTGGNLGSIVNSKISKTVSKRWEEGCYDHVDYKLYNSGRRHSDESKLKISKAQRGTNGYWYGKSFTDEHRSKIGNSIKAMYLDKNSQFYKNFINSMRSDEVRERISNSLKGKKPWNFGKTGVYTEETIRKMKESALNRNVNEETEKIRRQKISKHFTENHPNKKVVYYVKTNKEYKSIKDFCDETGISWYKTKRLRKEGKLIIK